MIENENKVKDIIRNGEGSIPSLRVKIHCGGSGEKVSVVFSNSRFSIKKISQVRKNAYDFQNKISKIPKQIVLFFETNFKLANITILGCIETLFDSVLSLKKESKNSLKSLPLYLEVEDFIRDLAKLVKLVQPV